MKLDVVSIQGQQTGRSVELPKEVFGIEPNEHCVWLAVKQYLANQRQGTHKSKERGEITGSRKKLHRQKGTGSSRKGDIKNPIFRGGGRVFGPRPRTYDSRLNKKVRKLARKSAFSVKAAAGQIRVIQDFSFDAPKTREFANIISSLDVNAKKTLFVTAELESEVLKSSSNVSKTLVRRACDVNTYDVMNSDVVVLCEGAIDKIRATFA